MTDPDDLREHFELSHEEHDAMAAALQAGLAAVEAADRELVDRLGRTPRAGFLGHIVREALLATVERMNEPQRAVTRHAVGDEGLAMVIAAGRELADGVVIVDGWRERGEPS